MAKAGINKRRRFVAPIGGAFLVLAFVGLVTLIVTSIALTGRILDNRGDKELLENIIRPVLMWDPPPFENPADVNPVQMLHFSMWAALMNSEYPFNENHEMEVPASDLDAAAARLFGPGAVTLRHRSFGDYDLSYYFDPARRVYLVPVAGQLFLYTPRVVSIERSGDFFNVRVGYVPPAGVFTANLQGALGEPEPDKYMIYVMRRTGNTYQIVALRDDPATIGEMHMPG